MSVTSGAESFGVGLDCANIVAPVMVDRGVGILLRLLDKVTPYGFFLLHRVRPKGVMCDGLMVADEEANEIGELLIRDSLNIQEEFNIASLDFWYGLNVDLAG